MLVAGLAAATAVWLWCRPPVRVAPVTGGAVLPVLALVSTVGIWTVGPWALVPLGAAWGGRRLLRARRRRVAAEAASAAVLETCELLAAEVAAGQPPELALGRAASAWPPLAPAAEAAVLGGDVSQVLQRVARTRGASDLRRVAAAWALAHRSGTGLGQTLDRVASSIRDDRATRRVVRGELASARATARLVAALPVVLLTLGGGSTASAWRFLLFSPLGLGCLVGGVGLGVTGLWWIERIADGVES